MQQTLQNPGAAFIADAQAMESEQSQAWLRSTTHL